MLPYRFTNTTPMLLSHSSFRRQATLLMRRSPSFLAMSDRRSSFVCMAVRSLVPSLFPSTSTHNRRPLRVGFPRTGRYPCYTSTMNRSDSRATVQTSSPLQIVSPYPLSRRPHGSPKFLQHAFDAIPRSQTPDERHITHHSVMHPVAFQHMNTVGLINIEYFGAQFLHLRCGLASPLLWLHPLRCLHGCTIGNGLLVRL